MTSRPEGSRHAAVAGLSVALAVPAALLLPTLASGGLAPVAVAGLVAAVLGSVVSLAEWRTEPARDPVWATLGDTSSDLIALVAIAAAAAPWAIAAGWLGAVAAVAGWGVAWGLTFVSARWQGGPAALGLILAVGAAVVAVARPVPPFTLLQPTFGTWMDWAGPAVVAGLWMGGIGHGQWTRGPSRRPGQNRPVWAGVGAGVLLLVALALHRAGRFEAGVASYDGVSAAVVGLVLVSAAAFVLARREDARPAAVLGAASTLWLVGPAAATLLFGWRVALPLAMTLSLGVLAHRQGRKGRSAPTLLAGGLLVAAAVLGWPGLPVGVTDGVVLGLGLTVGFWLVATRTALARRHRETP